MFHLSNGSRTLLKRWKTFNSVAFLIFETISDDAVDNDVDIDDNVDDEGGTDEDDPTQRVLPNIATIQHC